MKIVKHRERHAWCEDRKCQWSMTHDKPVTKGDDPIFAESHLHHAQTGHPVTVQKVTTLRYLPESAHYEEH